LIKANQYSDPEKDFLLIQKYISSADPDVLGELYAPYMHLVYGVCLKYFEDRDEAKDGVMQIFEKLVTELPKHKISNFKAWLYVLTKNFCLMEIRSRKSKSKNFDRWQKDQEHFMESSFEWHPIDEENIKLSEALKECIDKLKHDQQSCIQLFYYEDKCYQEISETLKMDEKKVKSHLQNGKRNLKICLESKNVREN
jgi:RNA polymerase sigma-70 factor (ECF subfamily)